MQKTSYHLLYLFVRIAIKRTPEQRQLIVQKHEGHGLYTENVTNFFFTHVSFKRERERDGGREGG